MVKERYSKLLREFVADLTPEEIVVLLYKDHLPYKEKFE